MIDSPLDEAPVPARIPADIEREDQVLGPFTARQTAWLVTGGLLLYGAYWLVRTWISPVAYLALVTPVAGVLIGLAMGRREGVTMDRYAAAALAHHRAPKRMVHTSEDLPELPAFLDPALVRQAGPAPVRAGLPCRGVDGAGLLDLGREGRAALARCSTVSFALRSGAEQQALVAGFGRWLDSLTSPVQVLVRSDSIDLAPTARRLHDEAGSLPHPALVRAARAHADHLAGLAPDRELLGRQVLVVARESGGAVAGVRAGQRVADAVTALAAADVEARPLTAAEAVEALHAACNPEPPGPRDDEAEEE
ncbi:PrgI family protein [Streptomyces sp. 4N509B]|uniref:PrgI family protein n=1 Tax=Streptomyces sp. 4N509B TaxID=3457413 RepID=UPI003FD62179